MRQLHIVHFNDVYNVESREQEPVGGAAKFVTKVRDIAKVKDVLVLFAGDAFSPSIMSSIAQGAQMPPVLNNIGVHCAAVGNHDLDFGLERMTELIRLCNFPWLMANVLTKDTHKPLPGCKRYHIVDWHDKLRIGIVGLVEYDWLATLATLTPDDIHYVNFVDEGRRIACELKQEHQCDIVIALTHMRVPNDELLATDVPEIDIVLGGHDHHYEVLKCGSHGTPVIKSGTDFRDLSLITMDICSRERPVMSSCEHIRITSDVPDDPATADIVAEYSREVSKKTEQVIGVTATALDGRSEIVRRGESNLGNFVADVARAELQCDVVLLNSGTLRSDSVHDAGPLKHRDLQAILPMPDEMVVVRVSGAQLLAALENGVSMFPKQEGRFLQVSGLRFAFDSAREPGDRVDAASVVVGDARLDRGASYSLGTKAYLVGGKDGFSMLKGLEELRCAEATPTLWQMVVSHFAALTKLSDEVEPHSSRRHSIDSETCTAVSDAALKRLHKAAELANGSDGSAIIRWDDHASAYVVDPAVEGRIVNVALCRVQAHEVAATA